MAVFPGLPGWAGARRNLILDFMMQGKKQRHTQWPSGWAPLHPDSRLITDPSPSSPIFYAGCPSCRNPPTLPWLRTGSKYGGLHTQWRGSKVYKRAEVIGTGRQTCSRSKIHRCIRVVGRTALQQIQWVTVRREEDDIITEVTSCNVVEMCHVVMTAVDVAVTAILILNLNITHIT